MKSVSLAVVRPDVEQLLLMHDRTPGILLERGREAGIPLSDLHDIKDLPKWAQRRFYKSYGWQFNWSFIGWAMIRAPKATQEEQAA